MSRQKDFGQVKLPNSFLCQDTNLLYLGAGETVSRSKHFQEGEYDVDIKSISTKEPITKSSEEETMNLKRAKETFELTSVQLETKIKRPSSKNTWRVYSAHPEFILKKNQSKRIPHEEDIEDTISQLFNERDRDMRSLIELFRSNQDEPRNKANLFGFPSHHRKISNWIQSNQNSDQRVINFTSWINRNFPDLDLGVLIGVFRSNQNESGYKLTCYIILTQPGSSLT